MKLKFFKKNVKTVKFYKKGEQITKRNKDYKISNLILVKLHETTEIVSWHYEKFCCTIHFILWSLTNQKRNTYTFQPLLNWSASWDRRQNRVRKISWDFFTDRYILIRINLQGSPFMVFNQGWFQNLRFKWKNFHAHLFHGLLKRNGVKFLNVSFLSFLPIFELFSFLFFSNETVVS